MVYFYWDEKWATPILLVDQTVGGYGLTGSVFATNPSIIWPAAEAVRYDSGSFYTS